MRIRVHIAKRADDTPAGTQLTALCGKKVTATRRLPRTPFGCRACMQQTVKRLNSTPFYTRVVTTITTTTGPAA